MTPRSNSVSGGLSFNCAETWPNSVAAPVRTTTALAAPLTTWVPMNRVLVRLARARVRRQDAGLFLHREGLAGEGRFVHEQVLGLQDEAIAGDDVPGVEDHHVAGHHLLHGNFLGLALTPHRGLDLDDGQELGHGVGGAPLLPETQQAAHQQDGQDDEGVGMVAQGKGKQAGEDQDEDDGTFVLRQQQGEGVGAFLGLEEIGARLGPGAARPRRGSSPGAKCPVGPADQPWGLLQKGFTGG